MELGIKIGERGSLEKMVNTYNWHYLRTHGLRVVGAYTQALTKNGYAIIDEYADVITYCGNGIWDVRKES